MVAMKTSQHDRYTVVLSEMPCTCLKLSLHCPQVGLTLCVGQKRSYCTLVVADGEVSHPERCSCEAISALTWRCWGGGGFKFYTPLVFPGLRDGNPSLIRCLTLVLVQHLELAVQSSSFSGCLVAQQIYKQGKAFVSISQLFNVKRIWWDLVCMVEDTSFHLERCLCCRDLLGRRLGRVDCCIVELTWHFAESLLQGLGAALVQTSHLCGPGRIVQLPPASPSSSSLI